MCVAIGDVCPAAPVSLQSFENGVFANPLFVIVDDHSIDFHPGVSLEWLAFEAEHDVRAAAGAAQERREHDRPVQTRTAPHQERAHVVDNGGDPLDVDRTQRGVRTGGELWTIAQVLAEPADVSLAG